jgi:hypothetical protein
MFAQSNVGIFNPCVSVFITSRFDPYVLRAWLNTEQADKAFSVIFGHVI